MLKVLGIMFAGILLGFLFRRLPLLQKLDKPLLYVIFILLFLMGLAVGGNPAIMESLPQIGGQALLLAVAGVLGSSLAALFVYNVFFKRRGDEK
ncbi:MAG: lysine exporter LysO family protein [Bacteroides sp.]|nr:lysine exporter LysO family protein [Ruminococcus flavefaciens]MCM1555841.1 lysine exporter LysO family protein [Bacteroides sp.]